MKKPFLQVLEIKATRTGSVICDDVSVSEQLVFVSYKSIEADRSSCVELSCTDAYFCPETVTESIGKSCGAVLIYSCGVHICHEVSCGIRVFCNDTVCVVGSVKVDV